MTTMEFEPHSKSHAAEAALAGARPEDTHAKFLDDLSKGGSLLDRLKNEPGIQLYKPAEAWKNGMASEELIPVEKWVADSKLCGAIDQDKLESKLSDFAQKADARWQSGDLLKISQDESITYSRFGKIFDLLDDTHRDKLLETLPWTLRPGE